MIFTGIHGNVPDLIQINAFPAIVIVSTVAQGQGSFVWIQNTALQCSAAYLGDLVESWRGGLGNFTAGMRDALKMFKSAALSVLMAVTPTGAASAALCLKELAGVTSQKGGLWDMLATILVLLSSLIISVY